MAVQFKIITICLYREIPHSEYLRVRARRRASAAVVQLMLDIEIGGVCTSTSWRSRLLEGRRPRRPCAMEVAFLAQRAPRPVPLPRWAFFGRWNGPGSHIHELALEATGGSAASPTGCVGSGVLGTTGTEAGAPPPLGVLWAMEGPGFHIHERALEATGGSAASTTVCDGSDVRLCAKSSAN